MYSLSEADGTRSKLSFLALKPDGIGRVARMVAEICLVRSKECHKNWEKPEAEIFERELGTAPVPLTLK